MAHGLAGLLLGLARHRAGVHDDEIGRRRIGFDAARAKEHGRDLVAFDTVDLAPQIDDRKAQASPERVS